MISCMAMLWMGCTHAPPAQPLSALPFLDIAYAEGPMAKLDVHRAQDGQPKRVLLFVHGGGWTGGDKANLAKAPGLTRWFKERGYAVVAPNFRRVATPRGPPTPITVQDMATDIAQSLRWVKTNRTEYGFDDAPVVLLGFSSGAHLVAWIASDVRHLEGVGLSLEDVAGSISMDVHAYDVPLALKLMQGSEIERNSVLIRSVFGETEAEQRSASPSSYLHAAVPPSLLISAEPSSEPTLKGHIARTASETHRDRLLEAGHSTTHLHFEKSSHGALVMRFGSSEHGPTQAVQSFLEQLQR